MVCSREIHKKILFKSLGSTFYFTGSFRSLGKVPAIQLLWFNNTHTNRDLGCVGFSTRVGIHKGEIRLLDHFNVFQVEELHEHQVEVHHGQEQVHHDRGEILFHREEVHLHVDMVHVLHEVGDVVVGEEEQLHVHVRVEDPLQDFGDEV